jgi:DUF971 family protein
MSGRHSLRSGILVASGLGLALVLTSAAPSQIAVRGGTVHTMAGPAITAGVVVIRDGRIVAIGPAASTPVPEGFRILEAAVVTPGLIDAHSVVGLAGWLNQEQDQDQIDPGAPIQPELRALDAYNPDDRLIEWVDGERSVYTAAQLRAICPCARCVNELTGVRMHDSASVSADLLQHDARMVGNYALAFRFSDGHDTGIFPFPMLRSHAPRHASS